MSITEGDGQPEFQEIRDDYRDVLRDESVLITGGAGFIGTALARVLAPRVARLTLVDSLHEDVHVSRVVDPSVEGATFVRGDVTDARLWDALLEGHAPTTIVHLAAETGTGQSFRQATRHAHVNVVGTTMMTDALLRHEKLPRHVLLASSRAVYGEGQWSVGGAAYYALPRTQRDLSRGQWNPPSPLDEPSQPVPSRADRTEPRPTNIYAATKLAQEHILNAWTGATGTALSILRLQNVYGPGQSLTNSYTGIVALFSRLSVSKQPIDLYEDGEIVRDFVNIEDVVQAIWRSLTRPPDERRVLDIGSGRPATLANVAQLLSGMEGAPPPFVSGKFREGDVRAAFCDIAPAASEIGYRSECSLTDGLQSLLTWVRSTI